MAHHEFGMVVVLLIFKNGIVSHYDDDMPNRISCHFSLPFTTDATLSIQAFGPRAPRFYSNQPRYPHRIYSNYDWDTHTLAAAADIALLTGAAAAPAAVRVAAVRGGSVARRRAREGARVGENFRCNFV